MSAWVTHDPHTGVVHGHTKLHQSMLCERLATAGIFCGLVGNLSVQTLVSLA